MTPSRQKTSLCALALCGAICVGCDSGESSEESGSNSNPANEETAAALCEGHEPLFTVQDYGGFIEDPFADLSIMYGHHFLHIDASCKVLAARAYPSALGTSQITLTDAQNFFDLELKVSKADRARYNGSDFGNAGCADGGVRTFSFASWAFSCYCGCDPQILPPELLPLVEASDAMLNRFTTGILAPTELWGVAAMSLTDRPEDPVWDPVVFMPVDSFSPALVQLLRLDGDAPHRIVDPLLQAEIAQLLTLYREFRADENWLVRNSSVAFLESATGERVELVHSPLFEPSYDRYFAH